MTKKVNSVKPSAKSGPAVRDNKASKDKAASTGANKKVSKVSTGKPTQQQQKQGGSKPKKNNKRTHNEIEDEEEDETVVDKEPVKKKKVADTKTSQWSQIEAFVNATDVLLVVLDARDPQRCKSKRLERLVLKHANKRIIYVLNKIDLVPRRNAEGWVKNLSQEYPTIPTKATTEEQSTVGIKELAGLLTRYASGTKKPSVVVGVIGYISVGRSSLIKALKQSKELAAKKEKIKLNETPESLPNDFGSSSDNGQKSHELAGPVELLLRSKLISAEDLTTAAASIAMRCKKETLLVNYTLPMYDDGNEFLSHLARQQGNIRKGGVHDTTAAARFFLREITTLDKLPYYTAPPRGSSSSTTSPWMKEFGTSVDKVIKIMDSQSSQIDSKLAVILSPQELQDGGEDK
ncbi:P-loop containing nucleoside triphosphate hydrolase protein [Mortierella sp. GBAus27b]|nr:Guanine nucleotide-binding protein-like 3 [Mortierella sp. GBA43]KAI8361272.1 P-loop containing nucleoside triphosphate hydrolase protein [Mortierella sp. GBAus27b]